MRNQLYQSKNLGSLRFYNRKEITDYNLETFVIQPLLKELPILKKCIDSLPKNNSYHRLFKQEYKAIQKELCKHRQNKM